MDIKNVTQFCNFLTSSGVVQLNPAFQQVVNCVQNYSAACNCHKTQDKQSLYAECNKLYSQCIMAVIPSIKYAVLQKCQMEDLLVIVIMELY